MDFNEELRNKRLNYYSRVLSASNNRIIDDHHHNGDGGGGGDENDLIEKIFGNSERKPIPKFIQSISFDEASSSLGDFFHQPANSISAASTSRRFEEFKKVVESSYEQHVLNKVVVDKKFAQQQEQRSTPSMPPPPALPLDNFIKIPYMSAYNIYDEDLLMSSARVHINFDVTGGSSVDGDSDGGGINGKKPLSSVAAAVGSNGSSLNASPTSISSSVESPPHRRPAEISVKPPVTPKPKSGELAFRKNLLRRSSASAATTTMTTPSTAISTTTYVNKPVIDFLQFDNSLESNTKPISTETNGLKANNLEVIAKMNKDGNTNEVAADSSSESGSDTFDIFSSRESLDESGDDEKPSKRQLQVLPPPPTPPLPPLPTTTITTKKLNAIANKMDLSIDLSGLHSDDDDGNHGHGNVDLIEIAPPKENNDQIDQLIPKRNNESHFISTTTTKTGKQTRQQVKPEHIPNLALDLVDDDKSQSVTVSLAKSMCKEIDYKKEMEAILSNSKESFASANANQSSVITFEPGTTKNNRLKPIDFDNIIKKKPKPKLPLQTNLLTSSIKQEPKKRQPLKIEPMSRSYFLRPLSSSRETTANFNRPNSSSTTLSSEQRQTAATKNSSEILKSYTRKSQSYLAKSSGELLAAELGRHWESASGYLVKRSNNLLAATRPSSAQALHVNRELALSKSKPELEPMISNHYSKLTAVEANFENTNRENSDEDFSSASTKEVEYKVDTLKAQDDKLEQQPEWLELPDELWLKILAHLKHSDLIQVGRTCKKLNKLHTDSSLWRKITVKYKYEMRDEWLDWIGKRRPNELNIIQCSGSLTLFAISDMFRNIGTQLTSLNLSRCSNGSLSGDNFALQASIRCPNVTNLDLSWTLLSNQTLKLIADSFKKIEIINLSGCNMIQEDGFNELLIKHGDSIKNLEISGCIHFSSDCLINIGVYCRNIERLNISNCHRMTNESLMESCQHWPKLKHIDFRGIKQIKNNCVSLLARKCPRLESIAFGECVNIGDNSILEIATYKPNIKYLDANSCKKLSDNSIMSLANFCAKLQYLNIKATNVTDIGLRSLANAKCASHLEELNLSYLPISEQVLLKLIRSCKKLKRIHLYGCFNIKNVESIRQDQQSTLSSLEILI